MALGDEFIRRGLRELGIEPAAPLISDLNFFLDELLIWNKKTNLVGTADRDGIIIRHVFDSLTVYPLLQGLKNPILDIGAGAGFPSIPLALADRGLRFEAAERRSRRAAFLRNVSGMLGLANYRVLECDAGDIPSPPGYDVVLARGVGEAALLYRVARNLLKESGMIIAFKGKIQEIDKEMARLREQINGDEKNVRFRVQKVRVPSLDEERNIVIIET